MFIIAEIAQAHESPPNPEGGVIIFNPSSL